MMRMTQGVTVKGIREAADKINLEKQENDKINLEKQENDKINLEKQENDKINLEKHDNDQTEEKEIIFSGGYSGKEKTSSEIMSEKVR
jgi:hypothetical protein